MTDPIDPNQPGSYGPPFPGPPAPAPPWNQAPPAQPQYEIQWAQPDQANFPGQYGVQPQPPYPVQPYPQPYPAPGYPGGYPNYYPNYYPSADPNRRPGAVTGAVILGFVAGGLLIAAGLLLLAGASFITAISDDVTTTDSHTALWLGLAGAANLVIAGLAIAGGIALLARKAVGRVLLTAAAVLDAICAIGWLTRGSGNLFLVAFLAVPVIVTVPLLWQRSVTTWLTPR